MSTRMQSVVEWCEGFCALLCLLLVPALAVMVLKIMMPLYPVFTLLFVLFFTSITFRKRSAAVLSLVGIALYVLSWLVLKPFGVWTSGICWAVGVMIWFVAVGHALSPPATSE